MRLTTAQMRMVAAVHVMQPATLKAIQVYLGGSYNSDMLNKLVRKGIIVRQKWQPPTIAATEPRYDENGDRIRRRMGKPPYMYRVAPGAAGIAARLDQVLRELEAFDAAPVSVRRAQCS